MTELKEKCVKQLEEVLVSVEKAMKDIQAGKYDEASAVLEQLKAGYQESKKAS
ncbi:MAG: hypothetical protein SFW65_03980 [Alphaproteobacteria bacterium]|nr:hypothetical protein [Alphaproteobacteria bacterium]